MTECAPSAVRDTGVTRIGAVSAVRTVYNDARFML